MTSPAHQHRLRHAAAAHAAAGAYMPSPNTSAYDLVRAKLAEDKRFLKGIQSVEQKISAKRNRLPEYLPWIDGVLTADTATQDDVFSALMVWAIDVGNYPLALLMGAHLLKHGLAMPEPFQRDVATVLVEEIADRFGTDESLKPEQLLELGAITDGRDMPDEVRAKLHKATGLALRDSAPEQALDHLQRALQLNQRIGVKTEISKLQKQLKPDASVT